MMDNFRSFDVAEDIPGAVAFLLDELAKGPFAPALAGDALDRFRIQSRLADFVRLHLAGRVVLISNAAYSPVGRPALALNDQLRNPDYWRKFRLSSLYRVWPDVQVDMAALARQGDDEVSFAKRFPLGLKVRGRVLRKTYGAAGFVVGVDIDGQTVPCLLPSEAVPAEFRATPDAIIGLDGTFEVAGTLPAKRSVLLRGIQIEQHRKAQVGGDSSATCTNVVRRLTLLRSFLDQLIDEVEAEAKREGGEGSI